MEIHTAQAFAAYSSPNTLSLNRPHGADVQEKISTNRVKYSDSVSFSQALKKYLEGSPKFGDAIENKGTAVFDTSKGEMEFDIEEYFTSGTPLQGGKLTFDSLPPLLFPTKNNIEALSEHLSSAFPNFLSQNNIPSAPSSITYDRQGQIVLPSDYEYATQLKQALEANPAMAKELSTVNALSSHYAEMAKSLPFQQEYAATTQAEIKAVVAKYAYLFSDNRSYSTIELHFSEQGELSITADGKTMV